jgi:surface antigen
MKAMRVAIPMILLSLPMPISALPVSNSSSTIRHWECVPIARSLSGIQIRGDAHTWWGQADGRYRRGNEPKRGAVLAFKPYGNMALGHVAAVSKVIDDRTILVTHSNWSRINGVRGQIERDVQVIDVSDEGDWSRVRVWFAPIADLGTTEWPVHGFIYPDRKAPMLLPMGGTEAAVRVVPVAAPAVGPTGRLDYLRKTLSKLKK